MEHSRLGNGLRWSTYFFQSETNLAANLASVISDDSLDESNDNYLITFPDGDSDDSIYRKEQPDTANNRAGCDSDYEIKERPDSAYESKERCDSTYQKLEQIDDIADEIPMPGLNCCNENPENFQPPSLSQSVRNSADLGLSLPSNWWSFRFCRGVNDFDIELEGEEAMPVVFLSTTRAAKLERALRIGCYKKVRLSQLSQ